MGEVVSYSWLPGVVLVVSAAIFLLMNKDDNKLKSKFIQCEKQHKDIVAKYDELRTTDTAYYKVVEEHIGLLERIIETKDARIKFLEDQYNALNGKVTRDRIEGEKAQ